MMHQSYSKGISWIDDCRIPFVDDRDSNKACNKNHEQGHYETNFFEGYYKRKGSDTQGRFPANILVSDDMLNDGVISKSTGGIPNGKSVYGRNSFNESSTINTQDKVGFGDKGSNSRYYDIDKWFEKLLDV
jgi:hypothetical protein